MKALIQFVQGASTPAAGLALLGVLTTNVVVHNGGDNTNVDRTIFELIDTGSGTSAIATGVAQDGSGTTYTFSPDARGGYLVHMTIVDADGNTDEDWRVFQVAEVSGRVIPPFGAEDWMMNFGGQTFGYSRYLNAYLRFFDAISLRHESTLTTGATIADTTTDQQVFLNFSASGNVHLPTPVAGLEIALTDISNAANTNPVTILPHASETLNGAASFILNTNRGSVTFRSDGTNWSIVARGNTPVTSTGFLHNTSGALDPAARAINLASADVTNLLPLSNQAAPTGNGFIKITAGAWPAAAAALGTGDIPNPGGDLGGTYATALVQQLSGGFGSNAGFVSVPSPAFIGFGAFATMATLGNIRFGNTQTVATNILMGRKSDNSANQILLSTDGSGNYSTGDFSWTVGTFQGGTAAALSTATGAFQYNTGKGLFYAAGGLITQSVTGLFVFNNPFDTLLTGWKFQLATTDILLVGQNADSVNALVATAAYQGATRTVATATYTIDASGPDETLFVDTTANVVTITLPTPRAGRRLWFTDVKNNFATNKFSLAPHGAEKIAGLAGTRDFIGAGESFIAISNGTDWAIWFC